MRYSWNSKQPCFIGCFSWMIPNLYIKNVCFTKHPLKTGCLGFQVSPYPTNHHPQLFIRAIHFTGNHNASTQRNLEKTRHLCGTFYTNITWHLQIAGAQNYHKIGLVFPYNDALFGLVSKKMNPCNNSRPKLAGQTGGFVSIIPS